MQELLAPREVVLPPVAERFRREAQEMIRLTSDQSHVLAGLSRNRRMAVSGCAGSGKTLLAVERTRRLADDGRRVLFVCFNRALRDLLADAEAETGADFLTFHMLCGRLAASAGIELAPYPPGRAPQRFYDRELPASLVDALSILGGQYDDIVADEVQDLSDDWLIALLATLRDERGGSLWLFLDSNQRVYPRKLTVPDDFATWELNVNCRNTQAVHREAMKYFGGGEVPLAPGPEGLAVRRIRAQDAAQAVHGEIERLCEGNVFPQDITVLSPRSAKSFWVAAGASGSYRLVPHRTSRGNAVYFSSIPAFKGLESPGRHPLRARGPD